MTGRGWPLDSPVPSGRRSESVAAAPTITAAPGLGLGGPVPPPVMSLAAQPCRYCGRPLIPDPAGFTHESGCAFEVHVPRPHADDDPTEAVRLAMVAMVTEAPIVARALVHERPGGLPPGRYDSLGRLRPPRRSR